MEANFSKAGAVSGMHAHSHPDVSAPTSSWSESRTLHIATAYSNPCRWNSRRRLMNDYRRHVASSPNTRLYVAELAYGDRPFEVTESSHPLDFQFRTRHELWHKENLLNLAVQRFPSDWQYGAIIDGDFSFTRHDWALEAIHLLQHYDWIQLFSSYSDLSPDHRPSPAIPSFAANYLKGGDVPGSYWLGSPGGAWAFRRSAFDATGGLLDTCVVGSADYYMAMGLIGKPDKRAETVQSTPQYRASIAAWQARAATLTKNIGCLDCHALHYWHGPKRQRGYEGRWKILVNYTFDPGTDLFRDSYGVYQLTPNKPGLRDAIRRYFRSRNEDSIDG